MLSRFEGRIGDAREFALRHRVLLLRATNCVPIDLALGALTFEERAASSARMEEIAPGVLLRLCGPAALLANKVFAGRPQDWLDVPGIVDKSGDRVD